MGKESLLVRFPNQPQANLSTFLEIKNACILFIHLSFLPSILPVHLLLHVGGVAAAVVGEQEPAVAQPVDVDLDVRAVHDDDVRSGGLASYLSVIKHSWG